MTAISWRPRADFPLPRAGYAAGAIDGRFVVAGGSYWSGDQKLRTKAVDIYDPATDRWSSGPPLPVALSDAVSVVTGGALCVIGGLTDQGANLDILLLKSGRWAVAAGLKLPEAKIRAAGAADGSHVYVIGGQKEFGNEAATDQVWMGDVASPSSGWTELPSYPAGPHVVSGAAVWSGALYVFGGFRIEKSAGENSGAIWRFDLGRHTWTKAGELPQPSRAFWAEAADREILLFGGYTDAFSPQVQAFDPRTGAIRAAGSLPQGVADAKFRRIGKRWYTVGGEVGVRIRGSHTWEGVSDHEA